MNMFLDWQKHNNNNKVNASNIRPLTKKRKRNPSNSSNRQRMRVVQTADNLTIAKILGARYVAELEYSVQKVFYFKYSLILR